MTVIVMCSLEFPFKILIDKMVNLRDFLKKNDLCTGPVLVTQQGGRLMKAVWFIKKARLVSEHISFPVHSNQLLWFESCTGGLIPEGIFNLSHPEKKLCEITVP
jgi:hypothetical protein